MYKLYSIIIYISIFLISLFFVQRSENALNNKQKRAFIVYAAIAIICPCLLSGIRGINVGTDSIRYYEMYEIAENYNNLTTYILRMSQRDVEVGYSVFLFVLSRLHISREVLFFLFTFLTIAPIYYVATKHKEEYPMWTGIAVFFAFYYNLSFNATRQCIAVSFVLLVYQMVIEKKYKQMVFFSFIALSFHSSAYIGFVFIVAGIVFKNLKVSVIRQAIVIVLFLVIAAAPLYLDQMFDILGGIGLVSDRQSFYQDLFAGQRQIEGSVGLEGGGYAAIILRILLLIIPGIDLFISGEIKDSEKKSIAIIVFMGTVFYVFTSIMFNTIHVYRITMYAEIFYVLYLPYLYRPVHSKQRGITVSLKTIIFVMLIFMYWLLIFIKFGFHQTSNFLMI